MDFLFNHYKSYNTGVNTLVMSVNNSLHSVNPPREDHKPTIYTRILNHLISNRLHPGKIYPVYALLNKNFYVFGAFTFNTGGTISFFPDLYGDLPFDHITVAKDFMKKGGHLTTIGASAKHSKLLEFDLEKLENDDYHVATFMMKDGSMMMDLFEKIDLPNMTLDEKETNKNISILQEATSNQVSIIDFPDNPGIFCIQVTLQVARRKEDKIQIYTKPIADFLETTRDLSKPIMAKKLEIYDGKFSDHSFYISAFRVEGNIPENSPMILAVNNGRLLQEIDIKILKKKDPASQNEGFKT